MAKGKRKKQQQQAQRRQQLQAKKGNNSNASNHVQPKQTTTAKATDVKCRHGKCSFENQVKRTLNKFSGRLLACTTCAAATKYVSKKNRKGVNTQATQNVGHNQDVWICVTCGTVACGRTTHRHAVIHASYNKNHLVAINPYTLQAWCYGCDDFLEVNVIGEEEEAAAVQQLAKQVVSDTISNVLYSREICFLAKHLVLEAIRGAGVSGRLSSHYSVGSFVFKERQLKPLAVCLDLVKTNYYDNLFDLMCAEDSSSSSSITSNSKKGKQSTNGVAQKGKNAKRVEEEYKGPLVPNNQGIKGLKNIGNTCFFNSVMQNLNQTLPLRDYFLRPGLELDGGKELCVAFREFLKNMWFSRPNTSGLSSYTPSYLFSEIARRNRMFRKYQQQDSYELLTLLLDDMKTELEGGECAKSDASTSDDSNNEEDCGSDEEGEIQKTSSRNTILDLTFGGDIASVVTCLYCGMKSEHLEPFLHVAVEFPGKFLPKVKIPSNYGNLNHNSSRKGKKGKTRGKQQSYHPPSPTIKPDTPPSKESRDDIKLPVVDLRNRELVDEIDVDQLSLTSCMKNFTDPETLLGSNKFYCSRCDCPRSASKQLVFTRLPEVLCVTIKRFTGFKKLSESVKFDISLDMRPFVLHDDMVEADYMEGDGYELYGCVEHQGGMGGGHYVSYSKVATDSGRGHWHYASDSSVQATTDRNVKSAQAYILFFERQKK